MIPRDDFEIEQLKDIGIFFAQLRYRKNKTQRDVGFMANLGQAAVTKFEKSQVDFKFGTMQVIARVLGYRVELYLVPLEGGEKILVEPDPNYRTKRSYANGTVVRSQPRVRRKPKKKQEILPGPQVEYETDDEFDTAKEMAALRARLGIG